MQALLSKLRGILSEETASDAVAALPVDLMKGDKKKKVVGEVTEGIGDVQQVLLSTDPYKRCIKNIQYFKGTFKDHKSIYKPGTDSIFTVGEIEKSVGEFEDKAAKLNIDADKFLNLLQHGKSLKMVKGLENFKDTIGEILYSKSHEGVFKYECRVDIDGIPHESIVCEDPDLIDKLNEVPGTYVSKNAIFPKDKFFDRKFFAELYEVVNE